MKVHLNQVYKPKHFKLKEPLYQISIDWAKLKEAYAPLNLDPGWLK